MAEEPDKIKKTAKQKLLFYTTAFFLLLGIFSLFGFLFLVPFIIEPAYTTIQMNFDLEPAECFTASTEKKRGLSNCSWTSCREGCTKEVYECTRIYVNYRHPNIPDNVLVPVQNVEPFEFSGGDDDWFLTDTPPHPPPIQEEDVYNIPETDYAYQEQEEGNFLDRDHEDHEGFFGGDSHSYVPSPSHPPLIKNRRTKMKWFYGARLFPNVKGCGYPPYLNCSLFNQTHFAVGKNYSCYFSRVDPSLVITHLDIQQAHLNLVCSSVIPVISFIASVVYLTVAYFYIYDIPNSEKSTPARRRPTTVAVDVGDGKAQNVIQVTPLALSTPIAPPTSGVLSPASDVFREDVASFGNQLKYAMVDDNMLSRESLDSNFSFNNFSTSSMNGNLNKMMTTCILTPPGPIAQL